MKFTHSVPLPVSTSVVDLAEWIFGMTDEEYRACAKGHHAMGVIGGAKRLGLINVEEIAGTLIVQHYRAVTAMPDHIHFVSDASEGFLIHLVPFNMHVWWDMSVVPAGEGTSVLHCSIGFEVPGWVTAASAVVGNNHFVRKHLVEETCNFAKDMTAKYGALSRGR